MSQTVIIALLIYFASNTLNMTWRRKFAKSTKLSSLTVTTITLTVFVWPISSIATHFLTLPSHNQLSATFWLTCVLAAICQVASSSIGFASLRSTDVANYNLLTQIYTPISILLATIFLSERLTSLQVIGAVLLLSGAFVVLKRPRAKLDLSRGNLLALLCGTFLGVGTFVARIAVREGGLGHYTTYGFLIQVGLLLAISSKRLRREASEIYSSWRDLTIMGIGRAGQLFCFLLASVYASNLSIVSSVTTFSVVLLFLSGYFFLHERANLRTKITGVLLATLGLLLSVT